MIVGGASCVGDSHKRNGIPLQDSHRVVSDKNAGFAIAVVADGAGSAKHAEIGSERITLILEGELRKLCEAGVPVSFVGFKETVFFAVQATRKSLVNDGYALRDCHATLVACLAFQDRCYTAHLGDGLQVVFVQEPNGQIAACVSEPENGEASNETYFFTEDSWHDHLRLTEIPRNILCCVLMSDGMEDFVWNPKSGIKPGFCGPLIDQVFETYQARGDLNELLAGVVQDPRTSQFTTDDKTLCVILDESHVFTLAKDGGNINQYVIRNGRPIRLQSISGAEKPQDKPNEKQPTESKFSISNSSESTRPRTNRVGNTSDTEKTEISQDRAGESDLTKAKKEVAVKQYQVITKLTSFFLWLLLLTATFFAGRYYPELNGLLHRSSGADKSLEARPDSSSGGKKSPHSTDGKSSSENSGVKEFEGVKPNFDLRPFEQSDQPPHSAAQPTVDAASGARPAVGQEDNLPVKALPSTNEASPSASSQTKGSESQPVATPKTKQEVSPSASKSSK
jgi:hypothetical protein